MGVPFRLVIYAESKERAQAAAEAAFARVSALNRIFSDYDPDSEAMRLSARAGTGDWHETSPELRTLLALAQRFWEDSDGAFDVTCGPFVQLWRKARRSGTLPSAHEVADARARTGMQHVVLAPVGRSVQLQREGMRLDFGAIAKGFALDEAIRVLNSHGFPRALAEAGGDVVAGDPPPGRSGWRIALAPLDPSAEPELFVELSRRGIATSGDAHQYVLIDGVRYSHIIDPRTGIGLTQHCIVTVVADTGAEADACATTAAVLGPGRGLAFIEARPGAAARFVVGTAEGRERHTSRLWSRLPLLQRDEVIDDKDD